MTVKVGNDTYNDVEKIEDCKSKNMTITLIFSDGNIKNIPVAYDEEIEFSKRMRKYIFVQECPKCGFIWEHWYKIGYCQKDGCVTRLKDKEIKYE